MCLSADIPFPTHSKNKLRHHAASQQEVEDIARKVVKNGGKRIKTLDQIWG